MPCATSTCATIIPCPTKMAAWHAYSRKESFSWDSELSLPSSTRTEWEGCVCHGHQLKPRPVFLQYRAFFGHRIPNTNSGWVISWSNKPHLPRSGDTNIPSELLGFARGKEKPRTLASAYWGLGSNKRKARLCQQPGLESLPVHSHVAQIHFPYQGLFLLQSSAWEPTLWNTMILRLSSCEGW